MTARWSPVAAAALVAASATACGSSSGTPADRATEGPAAHGTAQPEPGAAGIGDPYFPGDGNGGYDVEHYALDLRYDPATDRLAGRATIEALSTLSLSRLNLDLAGLEVASVTVDGARAEWARDGAELIVTPPEPLPEGRRFEVVVRYAGVPEGSGDELGAAGFMPTDDGALVAGQPDSAATWFPANDHPRDAASVTVAIDVPEGLEAVSNGRLLGSATEDGWTRWEWQADEPMAPYLVVLAIGEFDLHEYTAGGLAFWDALDPGLFNGAGAARGENAQAALDQQPEMIEFLSGLFGPYPFDVAGGIVDDHDEMGFALETQTRPVYAPSLFDDRQFGEVVVVHELAHQWFGDDLRLDGWQHIWLNEGLATYAEWLWTEHQGGMSAQAHFDELVAVPPSAPFHDELWGLPPGDPGPEAENLFSPAVYIRGAMTHHALRTEMGDEAYFDLLRTWASRHSGDTVTTEEFVDLAEELSGRQLDRFFDTWLHTPGRPEPLP